MTNDEIPKHEGSSKSPDRTSGRFRGRLRRLRGEASPSQDDGQQSGGLPEKHEYLAKNVMIGPTGTREVATFW